MEARVGRARSAGTSDGRHEFPTAATGARPGGLDDAGRCVVSADIDALLTLALAHNDAVSDNIARLRKSLAAAQKRSLQCAERRAALPAGSSRARVTTANANWARAAEHRDRIATLLELALAATGRTQP